jgi:hypothetical protein
MKNRSASVGKSPTRRAAPSLACSPARQPGAIPTAANADRVAANGGWYNIATLPLDAAPQAS